MSLSMLLLLLTSSLWRSIQPLSQVKRNKNITLWFITCWHLLITSFNAPHLKPFHLEVPLPPGTSNGHPSHTEASIYGLVSATQMPISLHFSELCMNLRCVCKHFLHYTLESTKKASTKNQGLQLCWKNSFTSQIWRPGEQSAGLMSWGMTGGWRVLHAFSLSFFSLSKYFSLKLSKPDPYVE